MLKKAIIVLLIGLSVFAVMHFISSQTRLFLGIERNLLNGLFFLREPGVHEQNPLVSQEVILLGFDEDAIASIGKWPWKRDVHAQMLNNLEKFSPRTVMFDVVFIKNETIPPFLSKKLTPEPNLLLKVEKAFNEMDRAFADALEKYDNVFLDVQLVEHPRPDLPKAYLSRILFNEQILKDYSLPLNDNQSLLVFHSLEPVLSEFISSAHPAIVNVLADDDDVTRMFPLYYTYKMSDGTIRNLFTAALLLVKRYYRVTNENIIITPEKVVLSDAKIPVLEPMTHQLKVFEKDFDWVKHKILNPVPPKSYSYNQNLFRLLLNRLKTSPGDQAKIPGFPIHVLKETGGFQILDGWEIFDAADQGMAEKVRLVVYDKGAIEIKTAMPGFSFINYAGTEKQYFMDQKTGIPTIFNTVPTQSYGKVYAMDPLPEIPPMDPSGRIKEDYDTRALEKWFLDFCEKQSYRAYNQAAKDLGDGVQDEVRLQEYFNRNSEIGKYFFYSYYFASANAPPGLLRTLIDQYPDFGRDAGQDSADFLADGVVVQDLMDVYEEQFHQFYNKFVFAGATARILGDIQQTPYGAMNGINTLINAFNTVITRNELTFSAHLPNFDLFILLGVCLFCCFVYGFTSIRISSVIFIILILGTLILSFALFSMKNIVLTTTPLVFSNVLIFGGIIVFKVLTEQKDKKFLKTTFSSYLAPEIIDEMYRNKTMPTLGGEARPITAYFTDIQSFSTFSEKLTADQLVELINEYLSAMTDILINEMGTLDKYEGDAIIAFFGAPMEVPDHALRACRVAVSMQEALARLCEKWSKEQQHPHEPDRNTKGLEPKEWKPGDRWPLIVHSMKMRIGINTGEIVVGNMGSAMRMNYTMMGDPVNLAARLEEAGKQYGVYILVSEDTLKWEITDDNENPKRVFDMVAVRFIDTIAVVGKSEPVRVYELCAMKGGLTEQEKELITLFDIGMKHYLNMAWDQAVAIFEKASKIERIPDGKTTPSQVYIDRCRAYKESPPVKPGEIWDGVCHLTKK
ncbi:MAG: adenylate/guanylate cyclase domain-containing protein [Deltaproteobacteria bacterium]|nr:adenylate/guanylate cyclase domain-containing protein [Deltaproteobacteria bacterium]